MTLIYNLQCGACGTNSNVSNLEMVKTIYWVCPNCKNESITSLPTTDDNALITEVADDPSQVVGDIIGGFSTSQAPVDE